MKIIGKISFVALAVQFSNRVKAKISIDIKSNCREHAEIYLKL